MKNAMRIILSFFAFAGTYYFIYWFAFSFLLGARNISPWSAIVSLAIAVLVAVFVWKKTAGTSNGLATCIVLGGLIVGGIGFVGGFFGPLIFTPEANLGPLLGIFITGPVGFGVGLIAGAIYWKIKEKKQVIVEG